MVTVPVQVKKCDYRGSDLKRQEDARAWNLAAWKIEEWINEAIRKQREEITVYKYEDVAEKTGYSLDLVRKICFSIDCGGNGFTAVRPG